MGGGIDSLRVGTDIIHGGVINNNKGFFNKRYFNRPGHIQYPSFQYFLYRATFSPSGNCIKRSCVLDIGGYDENFYPSSDYEFDARFLRKYKVGILWERLCKIYTDDSTSLKPETILGFVKTGLTLDKHVYNEIYDSQGKYDYIADIRYCITRRAAIAQGVDVGELPQNFKKYDSWLYRNLYRVYVNLNRLREIFERS